MSELTPNLAADVIAACGVGGGEAGDALGRALDGSFALGAADAPGTYSHAPPAGFDGPGLLIVLTIGGAGFAMVLPESCGMLPEWYAAPDATGESKLATLAQELGMLLVPETLAADKFEARHVPSLKAALTAACASADAALVSLPLTSGANQGALSLVWPLAAPGKAFAAETANPPVAPAASASQPAATAQAAQQAAAPNPAASQPTRSSVQALDELPHYSRSLLRITIPVSVHLAGKKETVQEVVEMVPGAIIKFDKGCDELLQLVVGGQLIAEGEAVKIGDKFGFRVSKMMLPREHFIPVRRPRAG